MSLLKFKIRSQLYSAAEWLYLVYLDTSELPTLILSSISSSKVSNENLPVTLNTSFICHISVQITEISVSGIGFIVLVSSPVWVVRINWREVLWAMWVP